jgi:hypothetical protein
MLQPIFLDKGSKGVVNHKGDFINITTAVTHLCKFRLELPQRGPRALHELPPSAKEKLAWQKEQFSFQFPWDTIQQKDDVPFLNEKEEPHG